MKRLQDRASRQPWEACLPISSSSLLVPVPCLSKAGKELADVGKVDSLLFISDCVRRAEVLLLNGERDSPWGSRLWAHFHTQFTTFQINSTENRFRYLGKGSGYVTSRAAALITLFWRASTNASWSTTAPALKWNLISWWVNEHVFTWERGKVSRKNNLLEISLSF